MIKFFIPNEKFTISERRISDLSICMLILIMAWSIYPWFFWNYRVITIFIFSVFFLGLRLLVFKANVGQSKFVLAILGLILFSEMTFPFLTTTTIFNYIRTISVVSCVIFMQDEEKQKIVRYTTNVFAFVITISLILYLIIVFIGLDLPHSTIMHPDASSEYPSYKNYFFLLIPNEPQLFYRCQSIFSEPGHLGLASAFLLYINHYKIKKIKILPIFLSLLLSLSLAAYLLLIAGYFIHQFAITKYFYRMVIKSFFGLLIIVFSGIYIYVNFTDSIVAQLIVARMDYDEEKGIAGNNRNSKHFEYYYENFFYKGSKWILGIGGEEFQNKLAGRSSSYKVFVVQYGVLGLVLLIVFYLGIIYNARSKLIIGLFLLYGISFWQRPYALWEIELFLFIGSATLFKLEEKTDE